MITIEKTFEPDLNWNKRLETNSQGSIYHTGLRNKAMIFALGMVSDIRLGANL